MPRTFSNEPWDAGAVESSLSSDDFCGVCLIDGNTPGQPKIKSKCKLPVQSRPDGAYNMNAMRAAMSRIGQMKNVPMSAMRSAARELVTLASDGGVTVESDSLRRMAGRM